MFQFYTFYEAIDFSRRKHQTATEMETDELTRCAVSAQLTIAHLQQVADFIDFQNRHPAQHITVAFHIGDILRTYYRYITHTPGFLARLTNPIHTIYVHRNMFRPQLFYIRKCQSSHIR